MELHERLALAREKAGYANATEAAKALGVPYPTYAGHENGSSGFRPDTGAKYAQRFRVRFEWLMRGRGAMTDVTVADPVVAEFVRLLPHLPEQRRLHLLSDLKDAARLEGLEESAPGKRGSEAKIGE